MPSSLRFQLPTDSKKVSTSSSLARPAKKARMSLSQTYYVASTARVKLGKEAVKADHDLRKLVGHANLLDSLMVELRDAEKQQEAWFHQSVASSTIEEEDSDDSDSDVEEDDFEIALPRSLRSAPVTISSLDDEEIFDDEDDLPELALTRTSSHPPELVHDSDSDDETPPNTPPQETFQQFTSEKTILDITYSGKISQSTLIQTAPLIEAY